VSLSTMLILMVAASCALGAVGVLRSNKDWLTKAIFAVMFLAFALVAVRVALIPDPKGCANAGVPSCQSVIP
jgi:hypothetical protein